MRLACTAFLLLAGCAPMVVTEYNGDSVRVQSDTRAVTAAAFDEARRICGTKGLKAEYASTWTSPATYFHHSHLFLCLSQTKANYGMPMGSIRRVTYLEDPGTL